MWGWFNPWTVADAHRVAIIHLSLTRVFSGEAFSDWSYMFQEGMGLTVSYSLPESETASIIHVKIILILFLHSKVSTFCSWAAFVTWQLEYWLQELQSAYENFDTNKQYLFTCISHAYTYWDRTWARSRTWRVRTTCLPATAPHSTSSWTGTQSSSSGSYTGREPATITHCKKNNEHYFQLMFNICTRKSNMHSTGDVVKNVE